MTTIGMPSVKEEKFRKNRLSAVAFDDSIAAAAMEHGDLGEKQFKMIVKLGHRADGGTRGSDRPALIDGDGRRNALNAFNIGLIHPIEKLPRIGGKAFDVPPLTLRVENVEGQCGFSRPTHARDNRQGV